jgi:hypothetical protein
MQIEVLVGVMADLAKKSGEKCGLAFEAQQHYLGGSNLKEAQMAQSKQVRVFVMGFITAALLFTVIAATTSNGPGPGRYRIETLESPTAMVVVLDTHTGELRYTGIGGAGGGKLIGAIEMFAELEPEK